MNKQEAIEIIKQQLEPYRAKHYSELIKMIDAEPKNYQYTAPSGAIYNIEIQAVWDDKPNAAVRVHGAIDDGGWRAYSPLSDDFIKNPDNEFIGE
jgi:hypothetical protein